MSRLQITKIYFVRKLIFSCNSHPTGSSAKFRLFREIFGVAFIMATHDKLYFDILKRTQMTKTFILKMILYNRILLCGNPSDI